MGGTGITSNAVRGDCAGGGSRCGRSSPDTSGDAPRRAGAGRGRTRRGQRRPPQRRPLPLRGPPRRTAADAAGPAAAVEMVEDAYRRVPAYRAFLDSHGGLPARLRGQSAQAWLAGLPTTSKATYIDGTRCSTAAGTAGSRPAAWRSTSRPARPARRTSGCARPTSWREVHRTLELLAGYVLDHGPAPTGPPADHGQRVLDGRLVDRRERLGRPQADGRAQELRPRRGEDPRGAAAVRPRTALHAVRLPARSWRPWPTPRLGPAWTWRRTTSPGSSVARA